MFSEKFEGQFPWFIIGEMNRDICKPLHVTSGNKTSLALFTDMDAAEEYRDQISPNSKVIPIPDETTLLSLAQVASQFADQFVLDPYKEGKVLRAGSLSKLIQILS